MAVVPRQAVSVGTSAVRLDSAPTDTVAGTRVTVIAQGSGTLVLGGTSTVTAINGCRLPVVTGTVLSIDLNAGEALYGIVATGTVSVDVLTAGA